MIDGYTVSYIRSPRIAELWEDDAEILARRDAAPVWVRTRRYMATTFHSELSFTVPSPMHRMFVDMVKSG